MDEAKQYSEGIIGYLNARVREVEARLTAITLGNPEWDYWYQIHKDLKGYIEDQEHTIGLIEDGEL